MWNFTQLHTGDNQHEQFWSWHGLMRTIIGQKIATVKRNAKGKKLPICFLSVAELKLNESKTLEVLAVNYTFIFYVNTVKMIRLFNCRSSCSSTGQMAMHYYVQCRIIIAIGALRITCSVSQ